MSQTASRAYRYTPGLTLLTCLTFTRTLASKVSISHALMKYSLEVGVAARTAHAQYRTSTRSFTTVHVNLLIP